MIITNQDIIGEKFCQYCATKLNSSNIVTVNASDKAIGIVNAWCISFLCGYCGHRHNYWFGVLTTGHKGGYWE